MKIVCEFLQEKNESLKLIRNVPITALQPLNVLSINSHYKTCWSILKYDLLWETPLYHTTYVINQNVLWSSVLSSRGVWFTQGLVWGLYLALYLLSRNEVCRDEGLHLGMARHFSPERALVAHARLTGVLELNKRGLVPISASKGTSIGRYEKPRCCWRTLSPGGCRGGSSAPAPLARLPRPGPAGLPPALPGSRWASSAVLGPLSSLRRCPGPAAMTGPCAEPPQRGAGGQGRYATFVALEEMAAHWAARAAGPRVQGERGVAGSDE